MGLRGPDKAEREHKGGIEHLERHQFELFPSQWRWLRENGNGGAAPKLRAILDELMHNAPKACQECSGWEPELRPCSECE